MKRVVGAAVLTLNLMNGAAWAGDRPAVAELFTSQGCSSCPPADALLGEVARSGNVLTLAYHVDYWDSLGWDDPFASAAATERQRRYARRLGLSGIYTPQMVVDGALDVVGSDRRAVSTALAGQRRGVDLRLTVANGALTVAVGAQKAAPASDLVLVAYSERAETKVKRGENAGRSLTEYSIVRGLYPLGKWSGDAARYEFDLTRLDGEATAVAVLLQEPDQGPIQGAATAKIR
jgi:hypothetical protein